MRQWLFFAAMLIACTVAAAQSPKVTEPSEDALKAFATVMDAAYGKDPVKLKSLIFRGEMPEEEVDALVAKIGEQIGKGLQRPRPVASARSGKIAVVIMRYRELGDAEDTVEPTFFIQDAQQWKLLLEDPQAEDLQADWEAIEGWADEKEDALDPSRAAPSTQPAEPAPAPGPSPMPQ